MKRQAVYVLGIVVSLFLTACSNTTVPASSSVMQSSAAPSSTVAEEKGDYVNVGSEASSEAPTATEEQATKKAEEEAKAKEQAEAKAKEQAEAKAKAQSEAKAKAQSEAKAKAEQQAQAQPVEEVQSNQTPLDIYNARLARALELYRNDFITIDEYEKIIRDTERKYGEKMRNGNHW